MLEPLTNLEHFCLDPGWWCDWISINVIIVNGFRYQPAKSLGNVVMLKNSGLATSCDCAISGFQTYGISGFEACGVFGSWPSRSASPFWSHSPGSCCLCQPSQSSDVHHLYGSDVPQPRHLHSVVHPPFPQVLHVGMALSGQQTWWWVSIPMWTESRSSSASLDALALN